MPFSKSAIPHYEALIPRSPSRREKQKTSINCLAVHRPENTELKKKELKKKYKELKKAIAKNNTDMWLMKNFLSNKEIEVAIFNEALTKFGSLAMPIETQTKNVIEKSE
jgi:preprotein translocase subunit SecA